MTTTATEPNDILPPGLAEPEIDPENIERPAPESLQLQFGDGFLLTVSANQHHGLSGSLVQRVDDQLVGIEFHGAGPGVLDLTVHPLVMSVGDDDEGA